MLLVCRFKDVGQFWDFGRRDPVRGLSGRIIDTDLRLARKTSLANELLHPERSSHFIVDVNPISRHVYSFKRSEN